MHACRSTLEDPTDADVQLDRSGPFGYTVRVVPRNESLASVAELGLVSTPA